MVVRAPAVDGHGGVGAGALPRGGEAGRYQVGVGAGHGVARHAQRPGDRALAGQSRAQGNAAVANQFLQRLAQAAIGGRAGEVADQRGEAVRGQ